MTIQESSAFGQRGKPGWREGEGRGRNSRCLCQNGLAQHKEKAWQLSLANGWSGEREEDKQTSLPWPLSKSRRSLAAHLLYVGLGVCVPRTGVWVARSEAMAQITFMFLAPGTRPGPGRVRVD